MAARLRNPSRGVVALPRRRRWLLVLLIVGFVFRLSGVLWGIPPIDAGYYHPDEPKVIRGACDFPRDIVERTDLRYPTFCHYSLGVLTLPLRAAVRASGHNPYRPVYMVGRLLSVLAGTATILLVYLLALRTDDDSHAWIAALVLAFSMFHVTHSAWATTDVTSSFLLAAFLLSLIMAFENDSWRLAALAGAALGSLIGTKYTGAIAVVPFLIVAFGYHFRRGGNNVRQALVGGLADSKIWTIGLVGLAFFLISTPAILIHPGNLLTSLAYEQDRIHDLQSSIADPAVWQQQFAVLVRTVGAPSAAAAIVGLLLTFLRRSRVDLALGATVVALFVYFREGLLGRYVILVMPVLAILASRALLWVTSSKRRPLRLAGLGLVTVVLVHAVTYSTRGILSRYPDSRTQASRFIASSIPPGATIGIAYTSPEYPWPTHRWRYPVVDFESYHYQDFLESPDYLIVSSYDAEKITQTLRQNVLSDEYQLPEELHKYWYRRSPPSPEIFEQFYELYFSDDPRYHLIFSFSPTRLWAPIELSAPTIDIFRRSPPGPVAQAVRP